MAEKQEKKGEKCFEVAGIELFVWLEVDGVGDALEKNPNKLNLSIWQFFEIREQIG